MLYSHRDAFHNIVQTFWWEDSAFAWRWTFLYAPCSLLTPPTLFFLNDNWCMKKTAEFTMSYSISAQYSRHIMVIYVFRLKAIDSCNRKKWRLVLKQQRGAKSCTNRLLLSILSHIHNPLNCILVFYFHFHSLICFCCFVCESVIHYFIVCEREKA